MRDGRSLSVEVRTTEEVLRLNIVSVTALIRNPSSNHCKQCLNAKFSCKFEMSRSRRYHEFIEHSSSVPFMPDRSPRIFNTAPKGRKRGLI